MGTVTMSTNGDVSGGGGGGGGDVGDDHEWVR